MNFTSKEAFILASASPRRKELFSLLGLPFDIVTSNVEETSVQASSASIYVEQVALLKTRDVAQHQRGKIVIGADTIVSFNDQLLHKPKTKEEAYAHLRTLSGQVHEVMTAVAIVLPNGEEHTFVEKTAVHFRPIDERLMDAYIASGDPFDKAGGYGIQTDGALFVKKIDGDYNNVVGLPIASLVDKLLSLQCISI
jgi:septum formation protein